MTDTDTVAVPRALLRQVRCDLLMARLQLTDPLPEGEYIVDALRRDYDRVAEILPPRTPAPPITHPVVPVDVAQCDLFGHEPADGRCELCGMPLVVVVDVVVDAELARWEDEGGYVAA